MNAPGAPRRLSVFERYLSLWVALCIVAGVAVGKLAPGLVGALSRVEDAREFLAKSGMDTDAIAAQVDGKFMSAFVRARKPTAR